MKPSVSPKTYYIVCVTLLILVALTASLAYVNLGPFNVVVAVGIAVCKALLIVLFFMHVRVSSKLIWLTAGAGFTWLMVLFTLSLGDYLTRGELHIPGK